MRNPTIDKLEKTINDLPEDERRVMKLIIGKVNMNSDNARKILKGTENGLINRVMEDWTKISIEYRKLWPDMEKLKKKKDLNLLDKNELNAYEHFRKTFGNPINFFTSAWANRIVNEDGYELYNFLSEKREPDFYDKVRESLIGTYKENKEISSKEMLNILKAFSEKGQDRVR